MRRELMLVVSLAALSSAVPFRGSDYTPLLHERMPCIAENVKDTDHYICTEDHKMICLNGWTNPENMCRDPVCSFESAHGGDPRTCDHGHCVRPNTCACEVGWEGVACDRCVKMPGCLHGSCQNEAFQCICDGDNQWKGAACDVPICKDGCDHGYCKEPGECICEEGWRGELCNECITLPGCQNGGCGKNPLECLCDEGWMGALCDCPICRTGCDMQHGYCTGENKDECLCYPGWKGVNCTECIPYQGPGCPTEATCNEPWECLCSEGVSGERCGHRVQHGHNLLPEYYHHEMSETCCQMNKQRGDEGDAAGSGNNNDNDQCEDCAG